MLLCKAVLHISNIIKLARSEIALHLAQNVLMITFNEKYLTIMTKVDVKKGKVGCRYQRNRKKAQEGKQPVHHQHQLHCVAS